MACAVLPWGAIAFSTRSLPLVATRETTLVVVHCLLSQVLQMRHIPIITREVVVLNELQMMWFASLSERLIWFRGIACQVRGHVTLLPFARFI